MTDPIIDMQALRVFLATAEDCNMTSAASRLGISQSAVSQTIRGLENYFGTVLVNRKRRPLVLTPAGLALRHRGAALLNETLNLRGSVIEASLGMKPDLRIGLVDSFAATFGTPLIQKLLAKVSRLSVRTGVTPHLNEGLLRREYDLVISSDPLEDLNGIARHRLLREQFFVIAPKSQALALRTVADLKSLADALPIVRFNQQSHLGAQIDQVLRRHGIKASRRLEVDTSDTLTSMVAGGIGWAVTTPLCLLQAREAGRAVRPVVIDALAGSRAVYLLAREDEYSTTVQQTFALAQSVLQARTLRELRALGPALVPLIQIDEWKDHD